MTYRDPESSGQFNKITRNSMLLIRSLNGNINGWMVFIPS